MKVNYYQNISDCLKNLGDKKSLISIGNFDGVHLGHQYIINESLKRARDNDLEFVLVTFDPHPVEIFAPDKKNFLIFPFENRIEQLKAIGCKHIVVLKFDRDFSVLSAQDFLERHFIKYKDKISELLLGHDFFFGADRLGDFAFAKEQLEKHEIKVGQLDKLSDFDVSSSLIRNNLIKGNVSKANKLLGKSFFIKGLVIKGEGRGKMIGIPTANINMSSRYIFPEPGVYVSQTSVNNIQFNSITNIGFRPTFGQNELNIETHIFNFNSDIYGELIKVSFLEKLREEKSFQSANDLVDQINRDITQAKSYFSDVKSSVLN